jgi:hypothetical protein
MVILHPSEITLLKVSQMLYNYVSVTIHRVPGLVTLYIPRYAAFLNVDP